MASDHRSIADAPRNTSQLAPAQYLAAASCGCAASSRFGSRVGELDGAPAAARGCAACACGCAACARDHACGCTAAGGPGDNGSARGRKRQSLGIGRNRASARAWTGCDSGECGACDIGIGGSGIIAGIGESGRRSGRIERGCGGDGAMEFTEAGCESDSGERGAWAWEDGGGRAGSTEVVMV